MTGPAFNDYGNTHPTIKPIDGMQSSVNHNLDNLDTNKKSYIM